MSDAADRWPTNAPMANVGSLARVALPEILKRIALNELSGSLEASSGKTARTIYFDRGFVVFTASTSKADGLGQCLIEAGRITEHELELAARLMGTRGRRIGQAIVAAGLLSEDELGRQLARQARRIAASIYALSKGTYRFEQQECPIPMEHRLSLSMYRLQLEGIRKMTNGKLILESMPPLDEVVRISKCPPFSFEDVHFLPIELLIMEAAQKERAMRAIVRRVGRGPDETMCGLYGLLSAGILERVDPVQTAIPLKVQEETGTFLLSTLDGDEDDTQAENVRQEVLLQFESTEHASSEKLLDVEAGATEEEVRSAFAARSAEWDAKQQELDYESTLCVKVDEIKRRLERAKEAMLAAEATATTNAVASPPEAPAPPETTTRPTKKPTSAKDEIKRLLREIKVRKMVEDNEGVISLLYEVVALEPENGKYEALLAQALGAHDVMKKKAERHFRRAVSLDPQNAQLHYFLGRYYQSFDMKSRALAEFKTALRIDPKFVKARAALVELKGDDSSLQDRLKGLFA
jgi:tetratricopeptide (TPR) repeat protein